MNFLVRYILSQPWAIDPQFIEANLSWIIALAKGESNVDIPKDVVFSSTSLVGAGGNRVNGEINSAQPGSIAVIRVSGPMMKSDQLCGPVGTATIGSWIKQADSNPNVDGIILVSDTPGGTVDGTEELADTIKNTKKPIVGLIDGMCGSAGYWIISQCDEIISNGQTPLIGSIGVMTSFANVRPMLEKAGIQFHEINSSLSPDKNKLYTEALEGKYDMLRKTLDATAQIFHSYVKAGRSNVKDTALTGHIYLAAEAKKQGLIDSIGNMDTAIKSIQKLKKQSSNMNKATLEKYPHVCALLGFKEGFESTDKGTFLNEDQLTSIESSLADASTKTEASAEDKNSIATLKQDLETAKASLNTANADLATVTTERDQWKTKAEEYGSHRASNGTNPPAPADEPTEPTTRKSSYVDDGSQALLDETRRKP